MNDQLARLEERLSRIESHNRALKLILMAIVCCVALAFVSNDVDSKAAKAEPQSAKQTELADVIRARRFEVVNKDGKPVWAATADENGGLIQIGDKDGKPVWETTADENGGLTRIFNKDGSPVWAATAAEDGSGSTIVNNKDGKPVWEATADPNGGGITEIFNKDGEKVWAAP